MTTFAAPLPTTTLTLDAHRAAFARRRFLAMPLAGTLAWTVVGVAGAVLTPRQATMVLYAATGSIVYLGMLLSRLTGKNFMEKTRPANPFDKLFLSSVAMAVLVYAIAIPFALQDPSSLPLSIGILAGLMWLPFSWIIQHWIGVAHTAGRTLLIVAAWFAWPAQRWTMIPAMIVGIYLFTMLVLETRWRRLQTGAVA